MIWVLIAVALALIWFAAFVDVVRRHDLGTWPKVAWSLVLLLVPLVGLAIYLIARPAGATHEYHLSDSAALNDERLRGQHPF